MDWRIVVIEFITHHPLLCSTVGTLIISIVGIIGLILELFADTCTDDVKLWLLVSIVRLCVRLVVRYYIEAVTQRWISFHGSILLLHKVLDIIDVFGFVWFAVGNLLVFNNVECSADAPIVFSTSVSYIGLTYLSVMIPSFIKCSLSCYPPASLEDRMYLLNLNAFDFRPGQNGAFYALNQDAGANLSTDQTEYWKNWLEQRGCFQFVYHAEEFTKLLQECRLPPNPNPNNPNPNLNNPNPNDSTSSGDMTNHRHIADAANEQKTRSRPTVSENMSGHMSAGDIETDSRASRQVEPQEGITSESELDGVAPMLRHQPQPQNTHLPSFSEALIDRVLPTNEDLSSSGSTRSHHTIPALPALPAALLTQEDDFTCPICLMAFEEPSEDLIPGNTNNTTGTGNGMGESELQMMTLTATAANTNNSNMRDASVLPLNTNTSTNTANTNTITNNANTNTNVNANTNANTGIMNSVVVRYPCANVHFFHAHCLRSWLQVSNSRGGNSHITCPCCRQTPRNLLPA